MVIYNRVRRKGYKFWFHGMQCIEERLLGVKHIGCELKKLFPANKHVLALLQDVSSPTIIKQRQANGRKKEKGLKVVLIELLNEHLQHYLQETCQNNPYVNTIMLDIKMKYNQQVTWLEKRRKRLRQEKGERERVYNNMKEKDKYDSRLEGMRGKLASITHQLDTLKLKPVTFGTKANFEKRLKGALSNEEFKIARDSSFSCTGKTQVKNFNFKILKDKTVKVHRFSKDKDTMWMTIPFTVNKSQEAGFKCILEAKKYTVTLLRRLNGEGIDYFIHVSIEIPDSKSVHCFENGAVGMDFNYDKASLTNIDKDGNFLSYQEIGFDSLNTLRKNNRDNYVGYKMDKVVNYCKNKGKGLIIEDLKFNQDFSFRKKRNRKVNNLRVSALGLLERKCIKAGVAIRKVNPAYTSIIGRYEYSRSRNLSVHVLASFVIARRGMGFKDENHLPPVYAWLLAQVGGMIKPRLKPSSAFNAWSRIHDLFKFSGITSYSTAEIMRTILSMKYVVYSNTCAQPHNPKAGLTPSGQVDDWYKFWNHVRGVSTARNINNVSTTYEQYSPTSLT